MIKRDRLTGTTGAIVSFAVIINRAAMAAIAIGFVATWLAPQFFMALLAEGGLGADQAALAGVRLFMLLGIATAIAADRLLIALAAIVTAAGAGDPFASDNARRLRMMAWALLALQLLDLPYALLAGHWPALGGEGPDFDISLGGWIATLTLFVLARAFDAGSAMRDDLAGTV